MREFPYTLLPAIAPHSLLEPTPTRLEYTMDQEKDVSLMYAGEWETIYKNTQNPIIADIKLHKHWDTFNVCT